MSLRSIQKRMYLGSLTDVENCFNNLTIYGEISKNINQEDMKKDLEAKLNSIYEINLQFYEEDFEIHTKSNSKALEIQVVYHDEFKIDNCIYPYDLTTDLLYRVFIVKTNLCDYLVMDFNHIIIDEEGIVNLLTILNEDIIGDVQSNNIVSDESEEERKFWKENSFKFNTYSSIPLQTNKKRTSYNVVKKTLELMKKSTNIDGGEIYEYKVK